MHEEEPPEEQALSLSCKIRDVLLSQSHDAQAVSRAREDNQLGQASQDNLEPDIERMDPAEAQALALPCEARDALLSQSYDTQDGLIPPEDLQLRQVTQDNPEPDVERAEPAEEQALDLPDAVQDGLLSQSCDAYEVVARLQEDLQLELTSLENPEPETKRMIRCLARKAKCSNRLDVVKHLREVAPAGTTGIKKCIYK